MNKERKVIIISAPSGSGKTTIVKHLLKVFPVLEFSISACSREKRSFETNGKDYYFISAGEFRERIRNKEFLEWEEVYESCYYGTLNSELERIWQQNKVVLFDVDVKGALNLKSMFGDSALSVFIMPPDMKELEKRLRNRSTETEESLKKRIAKARYEMKSMNRFDVIIVNDDINETYNNSEKIISRWLGRNHTI